MPLTPSPDHPIHRMRASEFAQLVEATLFEAIGNRQRGSQGMVDGRPDTKFSERLTGEQVTVETAKAPPFDPLGPPIPFLPDTALRTSREARKAAGLTPTFSGGLTGSFSELHVPLRLAARPFGKALDVAKLGNDDAQRQRIAELVAKFSDQQKLEARKAAMVADTGNYPVELVQELERVKQVPVKLTIDGHQQTVMFDNVRIGREMGNDVRIGDKNAVLAHVLMAAGMNVRTLGGRPDLETKFITSAIGNFSDILVTTDAVYDYLRAELVKKKIPDPDKVLKDSGLGFDSKAAEAALLSQVPIIKLSSVISPLASSMHIDTMVAPLLAVVGEKLDDVPAIHNAEHGARLLEAMLLRIHSHEHHNRVKFTVNDEAVKRHVRSSALARPHDVAALVANKDVQAMLVAAKAVANTEKDDPYLHHGRDDMVRGLQTLERALARQEEVATVLAQTKPGSSLRAAAEAGMNRDALEAATAQVMQAFSKEAEAKKGFGALIREEMALRAHKAKGDVPPLP